MATPAQLSEKARIELDLPRPTSPSLEPPTPRGRPPPLPPRQNTVQGPPAYTSEDARRSQLISEQWRSNDPRSSSTHSLLPTESARNGRDGRRTLLLIYIHGFMGTETSFQSFPAHIHNLTTIQLADTHVVHTKTYPRYKSRKDIQYARDDFSNWLKPHEDRGVDIILLGHSMGGILSAEVVIKPPSSPATGRQFEHRILGTINFDTPFLGMHPGVVASGIGSLFRPAPEKPDLNSRKDSASGTSSAAGQSQVSLVASSSASRADSETTSQFSRVTSPLAEPSPNDPYFNPPFPNDVRQAERSGWSNLLHFINKHSDGNTTMMKINALTSATGSYFMSHLEFGGCLADYPGMKNRYEKLRSLEDVNDLEGRGNLGYRPPTTRVRFVNYYTASTGRAKVIKPQVIPEVDENGQPKPIEAEMEEMTLTSSPGQHSVTTPTILVGNPSDGVSMPQTNDAAWGSTSIEEQVYNMGENSGVTNDFQKLPEMQHIDSMPIEDDEEPLPVQVLAADVTNDAEPTVELKPVASEPSLPPIPPMPVEPEVIDLSIYTDKDSRKIAEREQKRLQKVFQQAVKDREIAIKDRTKLLEKREKKARQDREKQLKAEEKQRLKEEKEVEKLKATINPETREWSASVATSTKEDDDKPKRDKKFCMLPPKYGGKRDECWVRVYMEGVDEVGAHTGLFFSGPQYESLVGDVGERIANWVEQDAKRRTMIDASGRE